MSCAHGMPSPASCIDCMDDGNLPVAKVTREDVDYTFLAQHVGQCPDCDLPITAGQEIAKTTRGRYLHVRCAP